MSFQLVTDALNYVIVDFWKETGDDYATNMNLPLVSNEGPWKVLGIIAVYLMFVKSWGPKFMKNREPFDLKKILLVHDVIHVSGNLLIALVAGYYSRWTIDCWDCRRTGDPDLPHHKYLVQMEYLYFLFKFVDLFDTVFFILRKKFNQASFLHVFHHGLMPLGTWIALRYAPVGRFIIIGTVNAAVHTIMYSYYLLASLGPSVQPYLWWKKYLTVFQIAQFMYFLCHSIQGIFILNCDDFPKFLMLLELGHCIYFIMSFSDFFIKTYIGRRKVKTDQNSNNVSHGNKMTESAQMALIKAGG